MKSRVRGVMRPLGRLPVAAVCALLGCGQPTLISCPDGEVACSGGCVDLAADANNCGGCEIACSSGTCVAGVCAPGVVSACDVNNGGCSPDAACMELAGSVMCLCDPGFTGTGLQCAPCGMCDSTQFVAAPCTPFADTTCAPCSLPCESGMFEQQACGPQGDRICTLCTACTVGQFELAPCGTSQDTMCGQCALGCLACTGAGATCTACDAGFLLEAGMCVPPPPPICGNGLLEGSEACDDVNQADGDGCSSSCEIEANHYCFGAPSLCRPGSCLVEPATSLPLGPAFALDGAGTTSAAGLTFSQRSTIHTTADVTYPVLIEMDVVYTGDDITFIGARGTGLRDPGNSDEPTDSLRGRLSQCCGFPVELAAGDSTIASSTAPFVPSLGTPYRVRYVDDGFLASVEWFNLTNPGEGVGVNKLSSFHGTADRAFVGGGHLGGVTVSNLRVCDAPDLPVTSGLAARYSGIPSWTVVRDINGNVSEWQDASGNARHLAVNGTSPTFAPGSITGPQIGVDFGGGGRLNTAPFALTTDVTVFAVIRHQTPAQWGAIAHHGSRDLDWSLEQSGDSGNSDVLHWQTNNDNVAVEQSLTQGSSYILTGRFDGDTRYFSATAFVGSSPSPVSIVDAGHTIAVGDKVLFVGASDNNEASNAIIGEVIYFARALSDGERDAVIAYLRTIWNP